MPALAVRRSVGYVRGGEAPIYARGFHRLDATICDDVTERRLMVFGGGASVFGASSEFGASFDPETRELFGPGFDGYA